MLNMLLNLEQINPHVCVFFFFFLIKMADFKQLKRAEICWT